MAGKKRRQRADGLATRERILTAATGMFASGGYDATSLRQIAASAGIDIATLKYHFQDKQTLFAEVYAAGHHAFLAALMPCVEQLEATETSADVRDAATDLFVRMHDFVDENLAFVRLTMFRLLEDKIDPIPEEDQLQAIALATLEETFDALAARELIKPIEARSLVAFLITSFSLWQVVGRSRPEWAGEPTLDTPEGRQRSESFILTTVHRMLGVEEV